MEDDNEEMNPVLVAAVTAQVQMTFKVHSMIQYLGTFHADQVIAMLVEGGLSRPAAEAFFVHTISSMVGKNLKQLPDGRLSVISEPTKSREDTMQMFRNMLNKN